MKHTFLNFKQICGVYNAHIVISFPRCVLPVERQMKPAECHCVEHVGFYPMKSSAVRGRKRRSYMKLEMVRANRIWGSGAQWHNCAKATTLPKTRRNNNRRPAFDHFRRNKSGEVANDNGSLFRVELNGHALFYEHKRGAATPLDAEHVVDTD